MAGSRAIPIRDNFAQACLIEIVPAVINPDFAMVGIIEEGWRQKARQNVVVFEWGARSNAALGISGVNV